MRSLGDGIEVDSCVLRRVTSGPRNNTGGDGCAIPLIPNSDTCSLALYKNGGVLMEMGLVITGVWTEESSDGSQAWDCGTVGFDVHSSLPTACETDLFVAGLSVTIGLH